MIQTPGSNQDVLLLGTMRNVVLITICNSSERVVQGTELVQVFWTVDGSDLIRYVNSKSSEARLTARDPSHCNGSWILKWEYLFWITVIKLLILWRYVFYISLFVLLHPHEYWWLSAVANYLQIWLSLLELGLLFILGQYIIYRSYKK